MKVILLFNGYRCTKTVVVKSAQVLEKTELNHKQPKWHMKQWKTKANSIYTCLKLLQTEINFNLHCLFYYSIQRTQRMQDPGFASSVTLKGYFSLPINTKCSKVCGKPSSSWASVAAIQKKCLLNWWKTISPSNSYLRKYLHIPRN